MYVTEISNRIEKWSDEEYQTRLAKIIKISEETEYKGSSFCRLDLSSS